MNTLSTSLLSSFARRAPLRALALGATGACALLFTEHLCDELALAVSAYLLVFGLMGLYDCVSLEGPVRALNLFAGALSVAMGAASVVWRRYAVGTLPVFLGAFIMVSATAYLFIAVLCKAMPPIWPLLTLGGGIALCVFAFGFGGRSALSELFGTLALLCTLCEFQLRRTARDALRRA